MDSQPEDRRTKRSRQALQQAMITLLVEKPYEQITVQDIIDRADVVRSTFYAHYENKDSLLVDGFNQMLDRLVEQIDFSACENRLTCDVALLFQHAQGHFELYRALLWGPGLDVMVKDTPQALAQRIQKRLEDQSIGTEPSGVPVPVLAITVSGALLVLLKWWLDLKMPYTPSEMNTFFKHILVSGMQVDI